MSTPQRLIHSSITSHSKPFTAIGHSRPLPPLRRRPALGPHRKLGSVQCSSSSSSSSSSSAAGAAGSPSERPVVEADLIYDEEGRLVKQVQLQEQWQKHWQQQWQQWQEQQQQQQQQQPPTGSAQEASPAGAVQQPHQQQQPQQPQHQPEAQPQEQPPAAQQRQQLSSEERRQLWKRAIKLPMYSVGIMPILVSAAAVYLQTNVLDVARTLLFMLAATCIIAWLNLSNDVFDSHTGVDTGGYKPESVVNLTGSRTRVALLAFSLLGAGVFILYRLLSTVATPLPGKMLAAAVAMGYLYQGPPFRFSYLGLGEPLCFAAFGPLATCAFFLAQAPASAATLNPMIIGLSLMLGFSTTTILFCSHFHQVEGDRAAGKMSPLVRLGGEKAVEVLKVLVGFAHALALGMSIFGVLPFACWTSVMVSYPYANRMVKLAEAHWEDPEEVKVLKFYAIKWHIAFGLMLVLGLLLQKIM